VGEAGIEQIDCHVIDFGLLVFASLILEAGVVANWCLTFEFL
jgi:hypothetical protein